MKDSVQNIKGNALVADFAQIWSIACRILIKSAAELSKCSLKYEPTVFNINTNVKVGIFDKFDIHVCVSRVTYQIIVLRSGRMTMNFKCGGF